MKLQHQLPQRHEIEIHTKEIERQTEERKLSVLKNRLQAKILQSQRDRGQPSLFARAS
jgi:hypothetical protein